MARVFLSHSSRDRLAAIALKQWLVEQDPALADEIFLDLDPHTGVHPGERWKEALRRSNARCELVICLLSANWAASAECIAEYRTAESLDKLILTARLEPLPEGGITDEWQHCDLFGDGPSTTVPVEGGASVVFLTEGLQRLLRGLGRAGIGAEHFVWPPPKEPDRSPYRGWEPLQESDAAVFFGRDSEILRGLDSLRGMRNSGTASLFVVLGASGTGKSSYLRAGLLPRLRREGRLFLPLDIVRPGHDPLTGNGGLARSIHSLRVGLGLGKPDLADIKQACRQANSVQLRQLLIEAREAATAQADDDEENLPEPTLILPVDQAEELFNADASPRASLFLQLLTRLCEDTGPGSHIIVALTIRADRYQALQNAPELASLQSVLFNELKPMPAAQFKEVIVGPAVRASQAGRPLRVDPDLVDRLIADCAHGADTLPLLALTLKLLYEDYGASGRLSLAAYEAVGGLSMVVQNEIDDILSPDRHVRKAQLKQLRSAFIPWLATINPDNDEPMRRVARLSDLPPGSWLLIEAMVAKRLLIKDKREGETVVEVTLESLLRQWDDLAVWLDSEREGLKEADTLERASAAWERHQRGDAWLIEGERLVNAETLAVQPGFRERLEPVGSFLTASRQREDDRSLAERQRHEAELRAAREKQEEAETHAAVLRRRTRILRTFLAATVIAAIVAVLGFGLASVAQQEATVRNLEATALRLAAEGQAMVAGARPGGEIRGMQEMLAGQALRPSTVNERAIISTVVTKRNVRKLVNVGNPVNSLSFRPGGTSIASGSADGTVRVWDAGTGAPVGSPMTGHVGEVKSVAYSPAGTRVASGGADGTVRVWDAGSGAPVGSPMTGHQGAVNSIAYNPDGTRIASGGADGTVRVWDAGTGAPVGSPMKGHQGAVNSIAYSPDGTRIASGGADATVRVWDAATGAPVGSPMTGHQGAVNSIAYSHKGTRIASGSDDRSIRLWDPVAQAPVGQPMTGHKNRVLTIAFSPDDSRVASGSEDYTMQLWDGATGRVLGDPTAGHGEEVRSVVFSPNGQRIVTGLEDGTMRIYDAVMLPPIIGHQGPVLTATFSRNGQQIASGGADGTVRVWDAGTGAPVGSPMMGHVGAVNSVAYSPDGTRIASGGADGTVRVRDASSGVPVVSPMTGHVGAVNSIAYSPDGTRIASGGADGTVRVWDAGTGAPVGSPMTGHVGEVQGVAYSPNGTRIASGGADGTVRVWDAGTGAPVGSQMKGHQGAVNGIAYSPDGTRIASGGSDRTVRLWIPEESKESGGPMRGHESSVTTVAFSPDGRRIASGSEDRTVRLWDPVAGLPLSDPFAGHLDSVTGIAFNPNNALLVTSSRDGAVRLWPAPATWTDTLCAMLTSNIGQKEWAAWVSPNIAYVAACPNLPPAP